MARRFRLLAERIVTSDLLKTPEKEASKKTEEKIRHSIEFDQRLITVKTFMERWNHWRRFYFNLDAVMPRTRGQLTSIENAIEFAKKEGYDISMLIAVVHKGYEKRRFKPGFSAIVQYGPDLYHSLYDAVISDIDRAEYERRSSRGLE